MSTITTRAGKGSPLTNAEVDSNFENLNTDKAELSGAAFTGAITTTSTIDGRDVATDGSKLDGIEAGATADQTDAEIRAAVEAATDSNVFTDADHSKLNAINQGVATTDSPTFAGLTASGEITANGGIALGDGDVATFGDSDDLSIFHAGGTTYLTNTTGSLVLRTDSFRVLNTANSEQILHGDANGAVTAYYDNAVKLTTTATGIQVTGDVDTSGLLKVGTNDTEYANNYIRFKPTGAAYIDHSTVGQAINFRLSNASSLDKTAMTLTSAGNVGVGTSSPSSALHVDSSNDGPIFDSGGTNNTNHALLVRDSANNQLLRVNNNGNVGIGTSSPSRQLEIYDDGTNGQAVLALTAQNTENSRIMFADPDDNNIGILDYSHADDSMRFTVNNAERMRIDASGNVLVGTTSTIPFTFSSGTGAGITNGGTIMAGATAEAGLFNRVGSDGAIIQLYKAGGIVGRIGTSGGDLTIGNGSTVGLIFEQTGSDRISPWNLTTNATRDGEIDLGDSNQRFKDLYLSGTAKSQAAELEDIKAKDTNGLNLQTSDGQKRVILDNSGNLLVGKTSTDDGVNGFKVAQTGVVTSTVSSPSTNTYLFYSGGYKFYVNTDGGISNFSANNVNLSDEREKKNIELLESQWDSLKQWSLKKFHYNADADSDNKKLGVIAQEVETHNPEVIDEFNVNDETTRMAVKEQQMMWMAIKALQEAQTRIETLEARVTELENN